MEITLKNQQKKIKITPSQLTKIVQKILRHEGIKAGFLSIVFVTDQKIKSFNKKYLNRNHVTDVLAFDFTEDALPLTSKGRKSSLHGEVIISAAAASRNAIEYRTTTFREIVLYIIHGILHLRGYDDHTQKDKNRMRKKEHELLNLVQPIIK